MPFRTLEKTRKKIQAKAYYKIGIYIININGVPDAKTNPKGMGKKMKTNYETVGQTTKTEITEMGAMSNAQVLINLSKELIEMEKESNRKVRQGERAMHDFHSENYFKRTFLVRRINELLDESVTFDEIQFRCFWQSGFIKTWNLCSTKDGYISTVKKYVDLYGTPLDKDTIMYKAVEKDEDIFGGSWTKDLKSAYNFAAKTLTSDIVSMVVPKGTKTIHFHPTFAFQESEDLIDTTGAINETLQKFATLTDLSIADSGIVTATFEKENNGNKVLHRLSKSDSKVSYIQYMEQAA